MMKSFAVLALILVSSAAHAADEAPAPSLAQQIYEGLSVPATASSLPPLLQNADHVNSKSVGGLTCFESYEGSVASYHCSVALDARSGKSQMKAIYNAIPDNMEKQESEMNGHKVFRKLLGGLDCERTRINFVESDYSCSLTL